MTAVAVPVVLVLGALAFWFLRGSEAELSAAPPERVSASAPPATAAAPGRLIVDAFPWGKLERVVDGGGLDVALPEDPYTPLVLSLPPGRYAVELSHPDLGGETRRCEVDVSVTAPGECRLELVEIQAKQYLEEAGWWR